MASSVCFGSSLIIITLPTVFHSSSHSNHPATLGFLNLLPTQKSLNTVHYRHQNICLYNMAQSSYTSSRLPLEHTTFGGKLRSYLERNLSNYDVTFCVGPKKIKVKALKIALKAASPELDILFKTKWDKGIDTIDGMISLPNFEPAAFQILLQLLYSDNLTAEDVTSMRLSFEILNNLTQIAYELEIWNWGLWRILYAAKAKLLRENFSLYIVSREFFELSRETLEEILGSEHVTLQETTLFKSACKWAELRCTQNEIEPNGENIRETLGDALFKIRFSLMSSLDFLSFVCPRKVLTNDEQERLLESIQLDEQKLANSIDLSEFNTEMRRLRILNRGVTLNFFIGFHIGNDPPFICNGKLCATEFQVNEKIVLESVGFLGPIGSDAVYEVFLELSLKRHTQNEDDVIVVFNVKIQAERLTIFHVPFPKPITLEGTLKDRQFSKRNDFYTIAYRLKGPNSEAVDIPQDPRDRSRFIFRQDRGVKFHGNWSANQLAELRFRRSSL